MRNNYLDFVLIRERDDAEQPWATLFRFLLQITSQTNQWRIQDFPLGGADLHGHFTARMYAKMTESGPVGGAPAPPPQDPPTLIFGH